MEPRCHIIFSRLCNNCHAHYNYSPWEILMENWRVIKFIKNEIKQKRLCTHDVTLRRIRITIFVTEKQCVTYSECVCVVLNIQHANRTSRIILSPVACPAIPHFSSLSQKRHDYCEFFFKNKFCVLIFFAIFVWNIYCPRRSEQRMT